MSKESITDTDVYLGQILGGKFRIEAILGRGGMGIVVAAMHLQLDELVALKFLLPEALENKEAVRRFEREARAAVKIKSEHVARVIDVGTLETGAPYMVMEFLNGMDLGDYLEAHGPLSFHEAADYLLQACEAIAEAHALGIVHRDLKPANLFRITRSDGTPSIKVLDFGISKVSTGRDASMTQTSSMMGSPYYMSPEQMTSAKSVDHRTDIWALGIILHELLTGKVPYQGETIPEICVQVLQNPPPRLTELRPGAPRDLEAIIEKALAKNREERYATIADFAADISAYASITAVHSVERISKVLGVVASARPSIQLADGFATPPLGTDKTTWGQKGFSDTTERPVASKTQESEALSVSTLGGAAHEQPDYKPPTSSNKIPVIIGAVALMAGAVIALVLSGGNDDVNEQEPIVASEVVSPGEAEQKAQPESPPEPSTDDPNKGEPKEPPSDKESVKPPATAETATQESETPPPKPVSAPAQKPAPRPAPKPAAAPKPRPAPAPAPQPAPGNSGLYLDRK